MKVSGRGAGGEEVVGGAAGLIAAVRSARSG